MTTETDLWKWLKKSRLHYKTRLHLNRIENSVMSGMPDVEGCLDGKQFWIELKCEDRPKRTATIVKPKFRPAQVPWLEKRKWAGGRGFVLLQVGQGQSAARRYLLSAASVLYLEENGWPQEMGIEQYAQTNPRGNANSIILAAAD